PREPEEPDQPTTKKIVRKEPTGAAAECYQHWRDRVWPRLSPVPCPTPAKGLFVQLDAKVKEFGRDVVIRAMDSAANNSWWVQNGLDLSSFLGNFAKFLPRKPAPPNGAGGPRVIAP